MEQKQQTLNKHNTYPQGNKETYSKHKKGQMFLKKKQLEILDVKQCNYLNKGLGRKFRWWNSYKGNSWG